MNTLSKFTFSLLAAGLTLAAPAEVAPAELAPPLADAVVDLRQDETAQLVAAHWQSQHAKIVEVDHRAPGPDLKASGEPIKTHNLEPRPGSPAFDSGWQAIAASSLEARRGSGRLSCVWYRLELTLPETLGGFAVAGSTAVFELVVDDYAEIWVDGKAPLALGKRGGAAVAGWNTPSRVVLTRDARPGQSFRLDILAANGPLSQPPANFIWVRSATLDLYRPGRYLAGERVPLQVERKSPALDTLVQPGTKLERLASGFQFLEGPVWVKDGGYLLFSDPNLNVIYRWAENEGVSIYRTKSGYAGANIGEYRQPGSNGLALDGEGRLTIDEHGNRRVTRLEKNGTLTVLADRYQGKRLNSPNDLAYRSDGALFFTDPPFGLPKFHNDPRRELPITGIFCLRNGELKLISSELSGPNGLAFSPDEKFLYVANWDEKKKVVMRYAVNTACDEVKGELFFDMTTAPGEEALDGLKVDERGNLYVSGPGGLWILSPQGEHLGTLEGPELAANFAWGDEDGKTLYWTARTGLYRLRLGVGGR